MTRRLLAPAVLGAATVLALAGCAGGAPAAGGASADSSSGKVTVVASTDVYGSIAEAVGGDFVDVTSIITSPTQDPHEYEASAQDQLTLKNAGLVIENGAGYDSFMEGLVQASGTTAPVITAVEYNHDYPGAESHDEAHSDDASPAPSESADDHDHADDDGHDHIEGFNEHVWYDPHTVEDLTAAIAKELGALAPDHAADFTSNAEAFTQQIAGLEDSLDQIKAKDAGAKIFVTEPVPVYLTTAAGLDNATPNEFSESVEEGQDVPPATLLESLQLLDSGQIKVMIVNPQTGGAEVTQVEDEAKAKNIPVIEFTETLPEGQTYISWMQSNITALSDALAA
ncbi:MAG: zinc ABC transporter substrate-binding protein [Microbacterium enclense]